MRTIILSLICCTICIKTAEAQLLNNVLKKAQNQIVDEISESILEKATEEITNKVLDNWYDKMDSIYYEAYEEDSIKGKYKSYPDFIASMDRSEEVPESYSFDYWLSIETSNNDEKPQNHEMFFAKDNSVFGIQMDEQFILWDNEKDLMITYNLEENTAFAMGNVMQFAGMMISESIDDELGIHEINKTGNTQSILGYHCEEYTGKSDKHEFTAFVTNEIPIEWHDGFGGFLEHIDSDGMNHMRSSMEGMAMKSESFSDGENSTYEVTSIKEELITIYKKEYQFNKQYKN